MTCLSVAVTHSENLLRSRRHCLQQPSPASLALPTFHISRHSPEMQGFGRRLAVDRSFLTGENRALFCLVEKILKTRRLIARIAAIRQRNWCEPVRTQGSPRWKPGDHAAGQWSQPALGFETGAIRKQSKGHARRRSRGSIRAGRARSVAVSFACRRIP